MTDLQINYLIDQLASKIKKENESSTKNEIEWIVIIGRKEFDHAYKIKSNSGRSFVQKIFYITQLLECEIQDCLDNPEHKLHEYLSGFIDYRNISGSIADIAKKYVHTFDQEDSIELLKVRKERYNQIFNHVISDPLETLSCSWWDYYITNMAERMDDVYFINNFTEL